MIYGRIDKNISKNIDNFKNFYNRFGEMKYDLLVQFKIMTLEKNEDGDVLPIKKFKINDNHLETVIQFG